MSEGRVLKVDITPAQLEVIKDLTDDISGMIGSGGDSDEVWLRKVKIVDRFLAKNNLPPRKFK